MERCLTQKTPVLSVGYGQVAGWHYFCKLVRAMDQRDHTDPLPAHHVLTEVKYDNVLCWVNSTDEPDQAFRVAKALADMGTGYYHVVLCMDSPHRTGERHRTDLGGQAPLTPEVISQAKGKLAQLYGEEAHTMVLPGHPLAEIRRYARNHHVDLIVMGEQGLAVERAYGERLSDDAPCPVIILALPRKEEQFPTPRRTTTTRRKDHRR